MLPNASLISYTAAPLQSPVTLLFMLRNRRGLRSSQSSSGVQCPSARSVSRRLGAVTTLGTPMDRPVPTLMRPTLSRVSLLTPVRKEKIVLLGLGGSTGLVGESSSFHGPPRRVIMRFCSLSRQRCFWSVVGGGSRGEVSIWMMGRVGALDWRLKRDWRIDLRLLFTGDMGDVFGVVSVDATRVSGDSGENTGVFSGSWIRMVGTLVSMVRPNVGAVFVVVSLLPLVDSEADVGRESCISTSSSCCDDEYDPIPLAPLGIW